LGRFLHALESHSDAAFLTQPVKPAQLLSVSPVWVSRMSAMRIATSMLFEISANQGLALDLNQAFCRSGEDVFSLSRHGKGRGSSARQLLKGNG
jgi:hypothetical protein